jgi:hypothetical protein
MQSYAYGFLPFVQLFVCSSVVLLACVRRRPWAGRFGESPAPDAGRCCACGYSTEGLRAGSVCPECGASAADREMPRRLIVDPERLRRWWLVVLINVITWVAVRPAAYVGMVLAYRRDGIDWGRASRWVGLRELSDGSPVSAFGLVSWLVILTTVVFPLCVLLPARWWRFAVRWGMVTWVGALVFSMWRVAAYC